MPWDAQLTTALEGILKNLREHLDEDFRALTQELSRAMAAERARVAADAAEAATVDVRRQAQLQIAQLRDATRLEAQEIRRAADLQIAELRRTLDEVRRNTQQQIEQARQAAGSEPAATHRAAADADTIRRRAALEVEDARRLAQIQVDDVQRQMQAQLERLRDDVRVDTAARGQQIVDGLRALDAAPSLRDVLEQLGTSAATQAERTVVFLVRSAMLVEVHRVGFAPSMPRIEFYLQDAGFMIDIVPTGTSASTAGGPLPPFASASDARDAVAMPVAVGGQVVAVLYCDARRQASGTQQWPAMVEVLARYASRVLEAMTVQHATGLWAPAAVAQGSHSR